MSNDWFQLKEFRVRQDRCAMKVGTDGVLLGAWAQGGQRILDIGTGTGLIALMMAQRYPQARIVAIDIDCEACKQAEENVATSPFADRIAVENVPLQQLNATEEFDAIVTNPPYFIDSLRNPDEQRALARHACSLPYKDLCKGVQLLLSSRGIFSVVLPTNNMEKFVAEAAFAGLYLYKQYKIKTHLRKEPKRCLMAFTKFRPDCLEIKECTLLDEQGQKSEWYKALTHAFYLH